MSCTALIGGLAAAEATKPVIVSALLIAALADNLTDSLSIHIFQESGEPQLSRQSGRSVQLAEKDAVTGTLTNFIARFLLCLSFVLLIVMLPFQHIIAESIAWGVLLLTALIFLVARERGIKPFPEIMKHLLLAFTVIATSIVIGYWTRLGSY